MFRNKREAREWASIIESEMARGVWRDRSEAESTTLSAALKRYLDIAKSKKGARQEIQRIGAMRSWPEGEMFLASIGGRK